MRIILVSIFVVCAVAAPTKAIHESEFSAREDAYQNATRDYDRFPGVRVLNIVADLRYYEVPEAAISEYLSLGLQFPPFDENWVNNINEFGEKWNNKWFSGIRWIEEKEMPTLMAGIEWKPENNAASRNAFNKKKTPIEDILVEYDNRNRLPEVANDEFYVNGLHLTPVTVERYARILSWAEKWGVKEIALMRYDSESQELNSFEETKTPSDEDKRNGELRDQFFYRLGAFYQKAGSLNYILRDLVVNGSHSEMRSYLRDRLKSFTQVDLRCLVVIGMKFIRDIAAEYRIDLGDTIDETDWEQLEQLGNEFWGEHLDKFGSYVSSAFEMDRFML